MFWFKDNFQVKILRGEGNWEENAGSNGVYLRSFLWELREALVWILKHHQPRTCCFLFLDFQRKACFSFFFYKTRDTNQSHSEKNSLVRTMSKESKESMSWHCQAFFFRVLKKVHVLANIPNFFFLMPKFVSWTIYLSQQNFYNVLYLIKPLDLESFTNFISFLNDLKSNHSPGVVLLKTARRSKAQFNLFISFYQ